MMVWRVRYVDLRARNSRRPFFNLEAYVTAGSRKEAVERVAQVFGPPAYGEYKASKAPGHESDHFFD